SLCRSILRAARSASRTSGPANFAAAASRPSAKSVPPLAALRSPKAILDPLLGLPGAVSVIVMKETSMTNFITAYFMDVEARTICSVAIDPANGLADIRRHIGCDLIDMVRIDRNHCVIVDDNGLADELPCFTELKGYASPLAGNLLIVGNDAAGDTVSPRRSIEEIAAMLMIRYPVLSPEFEMLNGPTVFGSRVSGFSVKLLDVAPTVVAPDPMS